MSTSADAVFQYHQRTKHQLNAYAKGPESLDWDDQPDPFRRFSGCETVKLPLQASEPDCRFADLDKPKQIQAQALTLANLSLLLELSFGLSAWKQFGPDRWALRCNPSSGNLHPTEAYLLCTDPDLLLPGVYHYVSHDHHLERRSRFLAQPEHAAIYIGLSSIHWREAWKYGERAFRYCQHDIGHALAGLSYAAATLGWSIELLSEISDCAIDHCLGLNREQDFVVNEPETADLICRLHVDNRQFVRFEETHLAQLQQTAEWHGKAKPLSGRHFYRWDIIDAVAAQTRKQADKFERWQAPEHKLALPSQNLPVAQLIRQRRSAQHFNAKAELMPLADFQRMLQTALTNPKPPFTAWNWPPQVHMLIFVHRVDGLEPGLYLLPRDHQAASELKQACSQDFSWQKMDMDFEFYQLVAGNLRQTAKTLSCHQPIASDSAFSLGMLARFSENINAEAWRYRRLFWECGLLGQILYLEAEAAGVRGTGIGCFFDDAVHGVLGLQDDSWQSLYHFTIGVPLNDNRLQTLPAYAHLSAET